MSRTQTISTNEELYERFKKHCEEIGATVSGRVRFLMRCDLGGMGENPMYYCMNSCGKYLGHRGFCSQKCHDEYYDKEKVKG